MGTANQIEQELMNYISDHKIRNTHSHHLPEQAMVDFERDKLINNTYLQWQQVTPGTTAESRNAYLEKTRYKSYFVWLQKAIGELYGISEPITAQNWDQISDQIRKAHQNPDFYMDVLKNKCKYQKVIVDTYWNPGSDNGRPELFTPAFRLDLFFLGYKKGLRNHDGVSLEENFGELPDNLQDYVEWVRKWIIQKKSEGCVALKIAMAYERSLHFEKVTREQAERVFRLKESDITQEDIRCFQDYLFWKICEIAAEVSLPLQCHTGMGQVIDTNILQLNNVIKNNPETKFVLLHCGFPWVDDLFSIVDGYPNLYPDLTWLPILSYTASKRVMHQLIEMSQIDKICWGCDTWTVEESYGSLLAFRFSLCSVLREKIEDRFRKLKIYGSMLHLVILKMIAEREGKEWPEQYLWIEDNISDEINKVQNKVVGPMFSQKEIEAAVEDMVSCGLLVKKHKKMFAVKGEPFLPKAKNIELMVTDDYMIFAEMIYRDYGWIKGGNVVDVLRKDISEYNDFDWFAWATNGMNMKEDAAESDYLPLLEHRCIVLSFDEANEIGAFLVCRSDVWKDYALTMMEIAEDYGEKWYWKIVSECIGNAKKIGNIHESYMLSHGDRRMLVYEMKKKDAQAGDLGVDVDFDAYDDFADSDIEDDNAKQKICSQLDDFDDFDDYA